MSAWVLQLPVERYAELTDKELEGINFNGGVVCFRLYISKLIELKYKTKNSTINVDSIIWKSGYDVLVVKFTQTYEFDYCPLRDSVAKYLGERNVKLYKYNVMYNNKLNEFGFYITVQCNKKEHEILSERLSAAEIKERLITLEPNLRAGVHIDYDFNDWWLIKYWIRNLRVPFSFDLKSDKWYTPNNKIKYAFHNKNCNFSFRHLPGEQIMQREKLLLTRIHDSMEFDKDELISTIENFDEFDSEGRTISSVCEREIAKYVGVEEKDVIVTKLDWQYDNSTKYLANYYINYYCNEKDLRDTINEYASKFDSEVLYCKITNEDSIIDVDLVFAENGFATSGKMRLLTEPYVEKMLSDKFPNLSFKVWVTFRVLF